MSKKETKKEEVVSEELAQEFEEAKEEFNEMTAGEEPPKKKKNYTALIVIIATIVVLGSIFGVTKLAKGYKKKTYGDTSTTVEKEEKAKEVQNNLSSDKKEIAGIKKDDDKKSEAVSAVLKEKEKQNTTDAYKKYEKLSDEQKSAQKIVPSKEKSPYKSVEEVKDVIEYDEAGLPNKYNLNNKIRLTVPNQKGYDLSWAFASMKTAETNYALNHNNKMPDFSEMHLDYFESDKYYGYRELHSGGGFYTFENYLVDNGGIVSENNMPFVDTDDIVKVVNNKREYFVNTTIYYPDYYYLDYDYETNTKNEMWENSFKDYIGVLKYHLVNFGALYATIMSPTPGASYFNNKTNALYFDGKYDDDYSYYFNRDAVTIVGYDDTYSKNNFKSSSKPSRDGAFIGMLADGKDAYNKGYIYISYEDMVVTSDVHGVLSTDINDAVKVSDIRSKAIKDVLLSKFGYAVVEYDGEQYISNVALDRSVSIDLSDKNLTEDDIGELYIFNNISRLDLSHNNLSDFDYLASSINNVADLDVSDNNYTFIPTYLPYKDFGYINLDGNNVSNVAGLSNLHINGLSISSDNSIYGLDQLSELFTLDISNTNFNLEELKDLTHLYNLNVKNVDLGDYNINSNTIEYFTCDNCNISSLENLQFSDVYGLDLPNNQITNLNGIDSVSKVRTLNLSNNKLTDISGIEKASNIIDLDISYNKDISDYSPLNDLFSENEYPTYEKIVEDWEEAPSKDKLDIKYYFRPDDERLNVSNNNISDISTFNNIDVYNLDVSSNLIEDVSEFNNENIMEINLAYNKDLKGLEKLSGLRGLSLANTNISDIDIIKDFKNLTWINLANNDVKDITPLNKLNRLGFVSLENNTNQEGELNNENISTLNVSNCNLNSLDNYNVTNLSIINISKNKNLENNIDKLKDNNQHYLDIIAEDLVFNYDDINDLKGSEDTVYVDGATIVYKANKEGNKVKIDDEKLAKRLFDYLSYGMLETENGYFGRLGKYITLDQEDLGNVNIYNQGGMYYRIEY